jgi:hypothetical protein
MDVADTKRAGITFDGNRTNAAAGRFWLAAKPFRSAFPEVVHVQLNAYSVPNY